MSWQYVWETPPHNLEQIGDTLSELCDDIDHAVAAMASARTSGGDLSGRINRFVSLVNNMFYGALCNWGMPGRIRLPLQKCLAPLRRVGLQRRGPNGQWLPHATVIIQAGSSSEQSLIALLGDDEIRPKFKKAKPFTQRVEKALEKAAPFTRKELRRAVPPSCERLQRAILKYLNKFVTPVGKKLESTWSGTLSPLDVESLKNRSFRACGPETGVIYCDFFLAMQKFFPRLRHVDIRDIVKPRLLKDATETAECVDAAIENSTHKLRFFGVETVKGVGVWREVIGELVETERVAVSVVMCGDDHGSKTNGRDTPQVVFRVVESTPEYNEPGESDAPEQSARLDGSQPARYGEGATAAGKTANEDWPPRGYVSVKDLQHDSRWSLDGKNPARSTIEGWIERHPPQPESKKNKRTQEVSVPLEWAEQRFRVWNPRKTPPGYT